MGETFVHGCIQARRTPGGNITIDTTHTSGGLIRSLGVRPHIEIENADLDDAIAALQAVRGRRFEVGDRVRVVAGAPHLGWIGQTGTVVKDLRAIEGRESKPWNVRIDGVPPQAPHLGYAPVVAFATDELQAVPAPDRQARYAPVPLTPDVIAAAERSPDLARKVEEAVAKTIADNHERMIAHLKGRPPEPRTAIDAFGELGRKMEQIATEAAQQPNPTFQAIAGDAQPDAIAATGRWRVYFNKHGSADLPWCIAPDVGGWELAVKDIRITTEARTIYQPKATPDDEDGRPSAWIAVEGRLVVTAGRASITATNEPEVKRP